MVVKSAGELCFVEMARNFFVCNPFEAHLQEINFLIISKKLIALVSYIFF